VRDTRTVLRRLAPVSAGMFAASLVLRPPLAAVGPLIPRLQQDLAISHTTAGLIPGSILLAMGVSSLAGPATVRRYGWFRPATAAVLLAGVAGLARAAMPTAALVVLLSVPIGIAAGLGGTALPTAVNDLYPNRRATGAAVHALGINVGAAGAAALAVPLAGGLGGWRGTFAFLALLGLLLSCVWIVAARDATERALPPTLALPVRNAHAWALTCLFALQGLCYYGLGAWLADAYVEQGWSQSAGGALVATVTGAAVPASFIVPRASERIGSRLLPLVASAAGLFVGSVALAAAPSLAWPAAVLVGVSLGGIFSLCLLLAIDLGRPSGMIAGFAGMMLGLGYCASALAPIALGAARDAAGSFSSGLWIVAAISGGILILLVLTRRLLAPNPIGLGTPTAED
jgi:MFS transporter, CP family, cyanate transporter